MTFCGLKSSLRQFDVFAKPLKDFRIQTTFGAFMTTISFTIIIVLFIAEFTDFISPATRQEIIVDISRDQKMSIEFNVTIPRVPCALLSVDTMDVSGDQQMSIMQNIVKSRIDPNGVLLPTVDEMSFQLEKSTTSCGSCYGAETETLKCCNTCEAVIAAHKAKGVSEIDKNNFEQCRESPYDANLASLIGKEGCRLLGHLGVNKVAGSFHISPGRSYSRNHAHVHDLGGLSGVQFDLSHYIGYLRFGATYPGHRNALDDSSWVSKFESPMLSYYLKLVPTTYVNIEGQLVTTNQYSATSQERHSIMSGSNEGIPGIFFNFEISPLLVKLSVDKKSFLHFLTNTCAIIGGIFTVASFLDTVVYKSSCLIFKSK